MSTKERIRSTRLLSVLVLAALPALLATGTLAGAERSSAAKGTADKLTVVLRRTSCKLSKSSVRAGLVTIRIQNRSGRRGSFGVAGKRSGAIRPKTTVSRRWRLAKGRYRYTCSPAGKGKLLVKAAVKKQPATGQPETGQPETGQPETGQPVTEHRIGVRNGEFYDRSSGQRFVPRGNEYLRIAPQRDEQHRPVLGHATFDVGRYDATRTETALERMHTLGYNTIGVAINALCDAGCAVDTASGRLSPAYFANVVDFLRRAQRNGIYVLLQTGFIYGPSAYTAQLDREPRDVVDNINLILLTDGGISLYEDFWTDVVRELRRQNAPFDAILGYEIFDEIAYIGNDKPFTLPNAVVQAPNGHSYSMASEEERRAMRDDSLVYWTDEIRSAILAVDPTALVTVGFFEPQHPNFSRPGDARLVETRGVIERSTADFVDLHPYPGYFLTLEQYAENFGIDRPVSKPLLMGEYGAFRASYPTLDEAAWALADWQSRSCSYGFDGWLLWTWDTDEQAELWNGTSGGGVISQALSPQTRPDPCAPPPASPETTNLALGKPVSASMTWGSGYEPERAVDGIPGSWWSSGEPAPQWIEIDLGQATSIGHVRLNPSQSPAGATVHRIWGKASAGDPYQLLQEVSGYSEDGTPIEVVPSSPRANVRFLRVETVSSPSWVGWREIQVYGSS